MKVITVLLMLLTSCMPWVREDYVPELDDVHYQTVGVGPYRYRLSYSTIDTGIRKELSPASFSATTMNGQPLDTWYDVVNKRIEIMNPETNTRDVYQVTDDGQLRRIIQ